MTKRFIAGLMTLVLVFGGAALPQNVNVIDTSITASAANRVEGYFEYAFIDDVRSGVNILGYSGNESNVVIPSYINGAPVVGIGDYAICHNGMTSVTIPETVKSIGAYAFYHCSNLSAINNGSGISNIGMNAFGCCTSLKKITIPDSVTEIGCDAFDSCSNLENIKFPNSIF